MFFLLRMCFWLGLVLLLLPGLGGGGTGASSPADTKVGAMEALSAASSAVADAGGFCARQPQACAIGANLLEMIGDRAQEGARFALAYISSQIVEEKRKAAERALGAPAGDTLTTRDLSPAWQGPKLQPASSAAPAAAPGGVPEVPLPPKRPA